VSATGEVSEEDQPPRLAAAFGGGGTFGIGYALGVCNALTDAGVHVAAADMLGTSAGAWVAACLATGVEFSDLCAIPQVRVPDQTAGLLQGIATTLFDDAYDARVTTTAVRLPTTRRVLLNGGKHRLADIVAASSAVPGLFRPARVDNAWYVDGGVRSLVSAHLAAPAQQLLVVAPLAGPMFGPTGRAMELMLRREIARWQHVTGGRAHVIKPNAQIAALARHPLQLFDNERAKRAYPLAYAQARDLLLTRPGLAQLLVSPKAA
jgi:predicted acylesterase/phospholipase RssA